MFKHYLLKVFQKITQLRTYVFSQKQRFQKNSGYFLKNTNHIFSQLTPKLAKQKIQVSKIKPRSGFTLIEMLIVISIIGILATMSIGSYQKTRQSADVNIQIDNFIDELRILKSKASNSNTTCYGMLITKTEIKNIQSNYVNPYTKCGNTIQVSDSSIKLNRNQILRDQQVQPLEQINVLFYPPLGNVYLPDLDLLGTESQESLIFKLALNDSKNNQIVTFNSTNGSIQKSYLNDSKKSASQNTSSTTNTIDSTNTSSTSNTESTPEINSETTPSINNSVNSSSIPIDNYDPLAPNSQNNISFSTGGGNSSNSGGSTLSGSTNHSSGGQISTPDLNYETNPETTPKQNPFLFVLITVFSIIIGTYLTRSQE